MNDRDGGKKRSLRALDWINFFMADVQTGVGPFVAIYLTATRHWNSAQVGFVVSAQSVATLIAQAPAGALVDRSTCKKRIIAIGAIVVAAGGIGIVLAQNTALEILTEVLIGIAAAVFPPAIAAIALGMVGKPALSRRVGRNEGFNHAGNVTFALGAGLIGSYLGQQWIFYTAAMFAIGTVIAALTIRNGDINNEAARAAVEPGDDGPPRQPKKIHDLLKDRRILIFTASVLLFHFANAAMLPLVGEVLSKRNPAESSMYMSACIVVAQFVMIPVALITAKFTDSIGRKPIFLIGFAVLAIRGALYTFGKSAPYLISVQSLDGVGAAIFGVLWVIIIADLAQGTGRSNLLQGAIQAALSAGAFLSNFVAGLVAKNMGQNVAFLGLAGIAVLGFVFFAVFMPETKDKTIPKTPTPETGRLDSDSVPTPA